MYQPLLLRKRIVAFCTAAILILPIGAFAQIAIKGTVTDQVKNEPMSGVSVELKGTGKGTVTDAAGKYSISVPDKKATLVYTFIGYTPQEVEVGSQTNINIALSVTASSLNEVVVVGYGTQKRKDVTGSVVSVDKQRLEDMPNSNFAQALQGAIPGISINQNSSSAEGNDMSIVIRGKKSITASTGPLIILDGIPYNGAISDITTTDIASIDVLKDASAAAIYGSRGSNGVILVTTKKGSTGKAVITYDGFTGAMEIAHLPKILSPEEFYNFKKTREPNSITATEQAVYDSKNYPDWLDLATRTGTRTQHTLSVRGGGPNVKYFASLLYLGVKGIAENDDFKRISSRINLEANITNWLTYGTNTQLSYNDRSGVPAAFSGDDGAFMFNPLTRPYDSTGALSIYPWAEDTHFGNPLAPTLAKSQDNTYKVFTTNYLQVKIPFVPGLSYRLNTGIEYQSHTANTYYGRDTRKGLQAAGDFTNSNSTTRNYTIENVVNYEHGFGKHNIGFTGLYSYQYDDVQTNSLAAQGFPNDIMTFYQARVALAMQPNASYTKQTLISQMARINYGYDSRYMLTATIRRDGFSAFGANNKFATFPSLAFAWNAINESFMKGNKIFSNLKLRLSYGTNGNQAISEYATLAKLATRSYIDSTSTAPGYVPNSLATPNLKWETTNSANVGIDFGFLGGRLQGTIDAYKSQTHDLLLQRQISSVHGVSSILQNIGKTQNVGMELGLNSINIRNKNFTWTTDANISFNRNKILDLYGDGKSDTANQWFIGHPIDVSFRYAYDGVWQLTDDLSHSPQANVQAGYAKVRDVNKDNKIDGSDRTIVGNLQPSFTWGMGNTFKYKNISLYVFVYGVQGVEQPNSLLSDNNVQSGVRFNTAVKNWWTPTNPTNEFYANMLGANTYSAAILQSSSFVRVKDISLSYDFSPKFLQKAKLTKLKVYVETRNPFTITKWTGLDPELNSQTGVPLQREYLVGLNVSL